MLERGALLSGEISHLIFVVECEEPELLFRSPPDPLMTDPDSGLAIKDCCKERNSSSDKYVLRFRANGGSSTNTAFMDQYTQVAYRCQPHTMSLWFAPRYVLIVWPGFKSLLRS